MRIDGVETNLKQIIFIYLLPFIQMCVSISRSIWNMHANENENKNTIGWTERERKHDKCRCLLLPHTAHRWLYTRRTERFKAEFFFHSIQNLYLYSLIVYSVYRFIDLINKMNACRKVCADIAVNTCKPMRHLTSICPHCLSGNPICMRDSELQPYTFRILKQNGTVKTMKQISVNWMRSPHWAWVSYLHNKKKYCFSWNNLVQLIRQKKMRIYLFQWNMKERMFFSHILYTWISRSQ